MLWPLNLWPLSLLIIRVPFESFEAEELHHVISGMAKDKASSPDGFSMAFFHSFWEDIMKVFHK